MTRIYVNFDETDIELTDNSKYYDIKGKVVLGKQEAFQLHETFVKDDIVLVDKQHLYPRPSVHLCVGLYIFSSRNICLTYSAVSKMILEIKAEEDWYED